MFASYYAVASFSSIGSPSCFQSILNIRKGFPSKWKESTMFDMIFWVVVSGVCYFAYKLDSSLNAPPRFHQEYCQADDLPLLMKKPTLRSNQQSPNVRLSWASVNIRRWVIVMKWESKFYKRPFVFLNLEKFILLAVILLLLVPFAVQSCTIPKVN